MTKRIFATLAVALLCMWTAHEAGAVGRGGGGGGRGGGGASRGGGGARPSVSRPSGGSRPSMSRPSTPSLGGGGSRPQVSRPSTGGVSRPSGGSMSRPSVSRPSTGSPSYSRPNGGTGGLRPSTGSPQVRPGISGPSSGSRPSIDRPSTGGGRPEIGGGSGSRPSLPDLGGGAPPSIGGGDRPQVGSRPGAGDRPAIGSRPDISGGRPSTGDVSDFLGISPPAGGDRPSIGQRPGLDGSGDRPQIGSGDRPAVGGGDRPQIGGGDRPRPGGGDRPQVGGGDRPNRPDHPQIGGHDVNVNLNNRPSWANIDNSRVTNINNNWNQAITRPGRGDWVQNHPERIDRRNDWGNNVRDHWGHNHWNNNCFNHNWWNHHNFSWGCWNYHYWNHNYRWNYWWTVPTYAALTNWCTWNTPVWSEPVYYDYSSGGNVVYQDNSVYIDGQEICTADEYAESAAVLATVDPPADDQAAEDMQWMALGTFAIAAGEQDVDPSRIIQLAVSQTGIISGTYFNTETDQALSVLGQVDKETQRVAFRIGDSDTVIYETGIYNLTQEEAPVLVHIGTDRTENYLLVRLPEPEDDGSDDGSGDGSAPTTDAAAPATG